MTNLLLKTFTPTWRDILRQNFTRLDLLADFLKLSSEQRKQLINRSDFPLNLPLRLAKKIQPGTLEDPILKQFVPTLHENEIHPDFVLDPVCDQTFRQSPKLLKKYQGRALLVCTSACAMHCRYCFRQNFDYEKEKLFTEELDNLAKDISIQEVILSGGDPLSLSNERLSALLFELAQMPHVKRIRFHTRFPIGIPERIDEEFLSIISQIPKQIWFVIHVNHPKELDSDIFYSLQALQERRCVILNQSVLLKGVNDECSILKELFDQLANQGIFSYYLHQLDRVQGAAHFEVPEEVGQSLIMELTKLLPGYAVPKYVREIAGQPNKTPL